MAKRAGLSMPGVAALSTVLLVGACSPAGVGPPSTAAHPTSSSVPSSPAKSATPSSRPTDPVDCARHTLRRLTESERVGQLVVVGLRADHDPSWAIAAVRSYGLGGVTFTGRSYAGVAAIRATTHRLQQAAPIPLIVATDQEGGQVQVLHGPGFAELPTALVQGRESTVQLQEQATDWARELRAAGVSMDLAPVLDVVPTALGTANQPIGRYHREYGHTPGRVSDHGLAVLTGLEAGGVVPVVKHFPGLGAVTGNTDVTAPVVDDVTTSDSLSLQPFRDAVNQGAPAVMVSSAVYTHLDPDRPAMFSPTVVTGLLRQTLGFRGVVISDDVGRAAAAKAYAPLPERSVDFVEAGGDILLTVRKNDPPVIVDALLQQVVADPAFAHDIDAAALRVLELKARAGLLTCSR